MRRRRGCSEGVFGGGFSEFISTECFQVGVWWVCFCFVFFFGTVFVKLFVERVETIFQRPGVWNIYV